MLRSCHGLNLSTSASIAKRSLLGAAFSCICSHVKYVMPSSLCAKSDAGAVFIFVKGKPRWNWISLLQQCAIVLPRHRSVHKGAYRWASLASYFFQVSKNNFCSSILFHIGRSIQPTRAVVGQASHVPSARWHWGRSEIKINPVYPN